MPRHIFLSCLAALSLTAGAQTLSTEITVDRTIVPEEHQATPLASVQPLFIKPSAAPIQLRPTEYSLVTDYAPLAGVFAAPVFTGIPAPADFRGYIRAGYFPAYNLGLNAGYRVLADSTDRLDVAAAFQGSSYNSAAVDENRKVVNNTFGVQADYAHTFASGLVVSADADFFHSSLKSPTPRAEKQSQNVDAFAVLLRAARTAKKISFDAHTTFDHFGLREDVGGLPGANSNFVGAEITGTGNISPEAGYGLRLGGGLLMGDGAWWRPSGVDYRGKKKIGNLTLNPTLHFATADIQVRVGVVLDYSKQFGTAVFHAAPDVQLVYSPAGTFTAFAIMDGGQDFASLRNLYNYSVYAPGAQMFGLSFTKIDGRAGFTIGPFAGASVQLYGRYTAATDAPMPLAGSVNEFRPVNLSGWSAGARLAYSYATLVKFDAEAALLPNSRCHGLATVMDRASFILNANLSVRPIEKLEAGLSFEHRGGRRIYALAGESSSLGAVDNLSVWGEYSVSRALAVSLHLENLLCKRPIILPGISAPALHGLLAATYRF